MYPSLLMAQMNNLNTTLRLPPSIHSSSGRKIFLDILGFPSRVQGEGSGARTEPLEMPMPRAHDAHWHSQSAAYMAVTTGRNCS